MMFHREVIDPPFASHAYEGFERIVSDCSYSAVVFAVTLKYLASS